VTLALAARLRDDAGNVQQNIYQPGAGTGRGSTGPASWQDRKEAASSASG
jgi:hypothetical protein